MDRRTKYKRLRNYIFLFGKNTLGKRSSRQDITGTNYCIDIQSWIPNLPNLYIINSQDFPPPPRVLESCSAVSHHFPQYKYWQLHRSFPAMTYKESPLAKIIMNFLHWEALCRRHDEISVCGVWTKTALFTRIIIIISPTDILMIKASWRKVRNWRDIICSIFPLWKLTSSTVGSVSPQMIQGLSDLITEGTTNPNSTFQVKEICTTYSCYILLLN